MAFDTPANRYGAMAIFPWMCWPPEADGVIHQADRQQVAGVYRGLLYYEPVFTYGCGWIRLGTRDRYDYGKAKRLGF